MPKRDAKQDLRVKRTLKNIRSAFYDLILEKDYNSISITELTEKADINRKTFYLHYNSISDLTKEIEQEILTELSGKFSHMDNPDDITECISIFYHYLEEGSPVIRKLLCDAEYKFFYSRLTTDLLETTFFRKFYTFTECPDLVRAYCITISTMYRSWANQGRVMPLDQLIEYAGKLVLNGYSSVKIS
ncbi:MAG: hypothetical protein K6F00_05215 [Lachnospiraceae bacterium]|nr:hypothetical protein [Lachnospiraceae bacterium]